MRVISCAECGTDIPLPDKGRGQYRKYCSDECGNLYRNRAYRIRLASDEPLPGRNKSDIPLAVRNILARVKYRAKTQGLPFNLDADDIVIPATCPVLGMPLSMQIGKGSGLHADSPSLDRIKPHLGYVKGNVRVISARANLLKSNATVSELERVLEDLRSL